MTGGRRIDETATPRKRHAAARVDGQNCPSRAALDWAFQPKSSRDAGSTVPRKEDAMKRLLSGGPHDGRTVRPNEEIEMERNRSRTKAVTRRLTAVIAMNKRLVSIGLVAISLAVTAHVQGAAPTVPQQATGGSTVLVDPRVEDAMAADGVADVIVGSNVDTLPAARLDAVAEVVQRNMVERTQDAALAGLAGTRHRVVRRYGSFPYMAMEADSAAINALRNSPHVRTIELDEEFVPNLTETPAIADFDATFETGLKGAGSTVAVLDTGVDRYHRFLTGAVVYEACFTSSATCPNGQDVQIGHGSAKPCALRGCDHGTHVAGIIAGRGATNAYGVASAANLYPIQVFSKKTCSIDAWFGFEYACLKAGKNDVIAALRHIYERRNAYRFAAANLSLGSTTVWSSRSECTTANWSFNDAIRDLKGAGIATVASSGNAGEEDATGRPACTLDAISVGATTKSDKVAGYSNSARWLDLLAPGDDVTSSIPGGGFETFSGTSMAAPHVSGAWAVLKSVAPEAEVDDVLASLRATGRLITDPKNDVTTPRIGVTSAVDHIGTIRVEDATAVNEGSVAAFRVTLAKSYAYQVSVRYKTVSGTAASPGDFTSIIYGQMVFQPGQTSRTINVQTIDDSYREGIETFSVELTSSSGARRNRSVATGKIRASDSITPTPPPYEGPGEFDY
jgi:subtilisin family serine protease